MDLKSSKIAWLKASAITYVQRDDACEYQQSEENEPESVIRFHRCP
jgi:hypothetical protein